MSQPEVPHPREAADYFKPVVPHANRPYLFGPYDPSYPHQFEAHAYDIADVIGSDGVRVEHVGSTAIPGLLGKPQIDIAVLFADRDHFEDTAAYQPGMQEAGYNYRADPSNMGEQYFTLESSGGIRKVSAHFLHIDNEWGRQLLVFRDYLREHSDECDMYGTVKKAGYDSFPNDYQEYYNHKAPTILQIMTRAIAWQQRKDRQI